MIIIQTSLSSARKRLAATAVETAFVASIFMLFLFGIIEYARMVMAYQGVQNCAREGARYAVSVINPESVPGSNIQDEVRSRMVFLDPDTSKYTVTVSGVVLRSGGTPGTPLPDWNYASNKDGVKVVVVYNYKPALPSFLMMNKTIPMTATAVMYSEGN